VTIVEPKPLPVAELVVELAPARLRIMRTVTGAVMVGPILGTVLAASLAVAYGVSPAAIGGFLIAYVLSMLGVTVGFHRHFAHRSFKTHRAIQALFIILGSNALQGSLLYWVSTHRRHHRFSDSAADPHSPHHDGNQPLRGLRGLWHGHIGWMYSSRVTNVVRFAPDIVRDPFVFGLQKRYGLWILTGLAAPVIVGLLIWGPSYRTLELFLWAGPVRLLAVHHASWAVGSLSHLYGRRPFETSDHSANNFWVAVVAFGEGLQNNHHAFPSAARHAFRWSEPDFSGVVIGLLARLGLVWDLNKPTPQQLDAVRRPATASASSPGAR
jgi:stearoyl-CoA desaturase (delta-9 desaturase)